MDKKKNDKIIRVKVNLSRIGRFFKSGRDVVLSGGAAYIGIKLYKMGFAVGSSAADGYFGGGVSMVGGAMVLGGVGLALYYACQNEDMRNGLIYGLNKLEQGANAVGRGIRKSNIIYQQKVKPFVRQKMKRLQKKARTGYPVGSRLDLSGPNIKVLKESSGKSL